MDFKEWLKPKVLVSGSAGLLIAFVISWLSLAVSLASIPCPPTGAPLLIDLHDPSPEFSTPVCVGQEIGWRSDKQLTVKFKNTKCAKSSNYPLSKQCGSSWCSETTKVKQPGSFYSSEYGQCNYQVVGGLVDPRVIVIGK